MVERLIQEGVDSGRVPKDISVQFLSENRDPESIAGILFITSLTFLVVAGRLASRCFIVKRVGIDDGLVLLSLICFIAFVGLAIKLILLGSGRHFAYIQYVMPVSTTLRTEVLDFAAHIIYTTALVLCRVSGLAFYHRICGAHTRFALFIWVAAALVVAGYLPQFFLLIFHCEPVTGLWPYGWEPGADKYTCLQWGLVYSANSGISLVCDFVLFGIPVAMLKMLNMSRKRKLQLASILLPGILVIAISITRLVLVIRGQWLADESWSYDPMLGVEATEIGATLIALSVPGIKPLMDKVFLRRDPSKTSQTEEAGYHRRSGGPPSYPSRRSTGVNDLELYAGHALGSGDHVGTSYVAEGKDSQEGSDSADKSSTARIYVTVDLKIEEDYKKKPRVL